MRNIVCFSLMVAAGMVVGAFADEAMESRTYPVSWEFVNKLHVAAESAGIPCNCEDYNKCHLGVLELLGVDWPEGSSICQSKTLGVMNVRNTPGNLEK